MWPTSGANCFPDPQQQQHVVYLNKASKIRFCSYIFPKIHGEGPPSLSPVVVQKFTCYDLEYTMVGICKYLSVFYRFMIKNNDQTLNSDCVFYDLDYVTGLHIRKFGK